MTLRRAALACLLLPALPACGERSRSNEKPAAAPASAPAASASPAPNSTAQAAAADGRERSKEDTPAATAVPALATSAEIAPGSVGTGSGDCHVIRGPVRLATSGAVLIGPGNGGLAAFAVNKLGAPAWETPKFPEPAKPGAATLLPKPTPSSPAPLAPAAPAPSSSATASSSAAPAASDDDKSRLPACAFAGGLTFCGDADGQIHRRGGAGDDDKIVAKGRRSTPVSAASAGGHTYYAFLGNQRTTEGVIVRAFVGVDDEVPIPLSEEGSGATFVGLVAREKDVLAMYIDARSALTPIHARTLRFDGRLVRGNDAVVFVGGSADGHVRGAVGRAASGPTYLFATGSHEDNRYGVVAIPVDGEPRDDIPGKWSFYPAPITTSPIAATAGKTPLRLARVRPENKDSGADQVVELGHVGEGGAFSEKCIVAKAASFSDVGVAVDERGNLWVAYTNQQGTWVEQRGDGK